MWTIFITKVGKPSANQHLALSASKDKWDTKEDKGKSIMHVLWYACQAEATSSSEKIKLAALAVIKLCFSEGISQSVSQSAKDPTG